MWLMLETMITIMRMSYNETDAKWEILSWIFNGDAIVI